jgi:hypothetical protein
MALTQPARSGTAPLSRAALALLLAPALLAAPLAPLDAQPGRRPVPSRPRTRRWRAPSSAGSATG